MCPRDNFTCANGNCLEISKMCDSYNDCGDNSDEGTICSGHIIINRKIFNSCYIHITIKISKEHF